jgi:acyl carrier protein
MTDKEFFILLKKKYKHLSKNKITIKQDLIKDYILDSLELMQFISVLEKTKKFELKNYIKKNNNFKISKILNFINKKNI